MIPGGYACDRLLSDTGFAAPVSFTLDSTAQLDKLFMNMHDALQRDPLYGNMKASGRLILKYTKLTIDVIEKREAMGKDHEVRPHAIKFSINHPCVPR